MRRAASSRCARLPGLRPGGASRLRTRLLAAGLLMAASWIAAGPAAAQTLLTQEQALDLAFPAPTRVERRTAYLSEAQLERARELAGSDVDVEQGIVTYYIGYRDGAATGVAYFDVHRVRTKNEVAMIVVDPDHQIRRVDVVKFAEPPEYRAPEGWIEQLEGRPLDDALSVRSGIRNLTGATLTARALAGAARRTLALHAVIDPLEGGP